MTFSFRRNLDIIHREELAWDAVEVSSLFCGAFMVREVLDDREHALCHTLLAAVIHDACRAIVFDRHNSGDCYLLIECLE
jgi:hypothetical protein